MQWSQLHDKIYRDRRFLYFKTEPTLRNCQSPWSFLFISIVSFRFHATTSKWNDTVSSFSSLGLSLSLSLSHSKFRRKRITRLWTFKETYQRTGRQIIQKRLSIRWFRFLFFVPRFSVSFFKSISRIGSERNDTDRLIVFSPREPSPDWTWLEAGKEGKGGERRKAEENEFAVADYRTVDFKSILKHARAMISPSPDSFSLFFFFFLLFFRCCVRCFWREVREDCRHRMTHDWWSSFESNENVGAHSVHLRWWLSERTTALKLARTNDLLCYDLFLLEIDGQFVHQLILYSIKIIQLIHY